MNSKLIINIIEDIIENKLMEDELDMLFHTVKKQSVFTMFSNIKYYKTYNISIINKTYIPDNLLNKKWIRNGTIRKQ